MFYWTVLFGGGRTWSWGLCQAMGQYGPLVWYCFFYICRLREQTVTFTLTNKQGVPILPTVVEHHQVQVGRTSKRDCGRKWAAWTESCLYSLAWRLGWRRQPLLDFLHKAKVKEAVGTKSIENLLNSGILSCQQCKKERSPGMVTWVIGHRLLRSNRWKCCSGCWPVWATVTLTLHFRDRLLWAPSLRPQVRSGAGLDRGEK